MTRCIRCHIEKPASEFYAHPTTTSGHQSKCKTCCKELARGYWESQGKQARNLKRALARDGRLNREERAARSKVMNAERVKKWHAAHPDRVKANIARWAAKHPEQAAESARRRTMHHYAQKRDAQGTATTEQIAARWAYYGNRCWMCRAPATQTDHVISLNRAGSDWPANQRPSCAPCNRMKSDRDHRIFLAKSA